MLDYGSLNALVRERPTIPKSSQKESHATTHAQSAPMMGLGGHLQGQNGNMPGQYGFPQSTMQTAIPYFGYQAVMPSAMQPQVNMTPVGVLPDGTTLVSHNGVSYRVYWNGVNTVMEPSQAIPLPLDQQYYPINYQQTLQNQPQYGTAFVSAPSNQTIPLATATNASPSGPQRKAKSDEEMELKAKLTNLDQHLALNHYDITPAERSNLVAQRRYLVEEIDKLRLSKGQYKHNIPIVAPATTLSTRPMLRHSSGAESNSIPPNSQVGISQKPQVAEGSTINKCLSPAAPPFVPSNHQSFSSATYTVNAQTKLCGKGPALNANGNVSPFTHVHDIDDDASISNSKVATHRHEASFSVLDPSDPAMRVIEYEDIEYAARYLYNWSKDTKTYCTTVAEFQEAIRRVREQARLYGCAGGQSKDPAYDAEQDLWWAICDRDPIPLPAQIPDHVANPRPWNWNDSAFNYRGNPLEYPGPECEKARNSPRVLGLDPSLTESMKDMMDVSRSYFALKGQLPSVPFRDFAYDRDGNRRLIQSETAVSAAYVDPPSKRKAPRPIFTNETEESIPKTCTPSMEALKAPRYIEVSGRHMSRVSLSQPQRAQKQSIPEEVHEPRTLEHSKTHLPIKSSKDQLDASPASKSLHSSKKAVNKSGILDTDDHYYPATPASRRVRSHPKEISTFQENRLSMPPPTIKIQDETFQNGNSELAVGGPMYSSVWGSGTTTGKDIAKAGPEAHQVEIAPKRFEEQNSGRTYRNPKIRANISMEKDSGYPRNRFLAPQTENQGVATRSMERQDRKSSDPEAESKHPWGPEYELTRPHPSDLQRGFWGPLRFDLDVGVHDAAKLPKVNIPDATTMRAPLPREYGTRGDPSGLYKFESQEVSSVKVSEYAPQRNAMCLF